MIGGLPRKFVLLRRKRLLTLISTVSLFMIWHIPLQQLYQIGQKKSSYMKHQHGRSLMANKQPTDDTKIDKGLDERIDGSEEILYVDEAQEQSQESIVAHQDQAYDDLFDQDLGGEFPYSYMINEREVCLDSPYIINMVPVKASDFKTRSTIRMLWGNPRHYNMTGVRVVFILGISRNSKQANGVQQRLLQESRRYRDIIQVNFIDSYKNLTLKTLSALHWMKHYCPSAHWFLKSDADVFVNTFALTKLLNRSSADFVCRPSTNNIVCRPGLCLSKYTVSKDQYAEDHYPQYCTGAAYAITADMAKGVYNRANKTHPFVIEDAYFTGILVEDLHPSYKYLDYHTFPFKVSHNISREWTGQRSAKKIFVLTKRGLVRNAYADLWSKILSYSLSL